MKGIHQLDCGVWVTNEDQTHVTWIEAAGKVDHDDYARSILVPLLRKGDVVIDVGAHWGTHTKMYLDAVGDSGQVVAYEPHPMSFECLRRNCPRALHWPGALGDKVGSAELQMAPDNAGASYLLAEGQGWKVPLSTLDSDLYSWLHQKLLRLIKVDVEGSEVEVLRGASQIIHDHRPYLFIEVNPGALKRRGYKVIDLVYLIGVLGYRTEKYPPQIGWEGPQFDILCKPV
jgi:FkbM family methyltransferase